MIKKTKEEVEKEANDVKKILGDQWEVRVWHNLGWCFCVSLENHIHVLKNRDGMYWVQIGKGSGQLAMFHTGFKSEDPIKAVVLNVDAYSKKLEKFIQEQRDVLVSGQKYVLRLPEHYLTEIE